MLETKTIRIVGYVCAATLFSAAALTFPFAAVAQDVTQSQAMSPAPVVAPTIPVVLMDGVSSPRTLATQGGTVADVLREAGVTLNSDDRVAPALTTPVTAQLAVTITRVRFADEKVTKSIPFRTVFQMSKAVRPGTIRQGHTGVPGVLTQTYRVGFVNGTRTSRWLLSSVVTRRPVDQQTLAGIRVQMAAALPSRGGAYNRMRSLMMTATGYSPYEGSGSGRCATGMRAGYGVVAVDPRVIRLGTRLYISGYGYAVAGDTGGAIKGRRIDLGSSTYSEAAQVGRRRVQVWVLSPSR